MSEVCAHQSAVAVWSCHLSPDDSDLAALSFLGCSVHESDFLAQVESRVHALEVVDFDVRGARSQSMALAEAPDKKGQRAKERT